MDGGKSKICKMLHLITCTVSVLDVLVRGWKLNWRRSGPSIRNTTFNLVSLQLSFPDFVRHRTRPLSRSGD